MELTCLLVMVYIQTVSPSVLDELFRQSVDISTLYIHVVRRLLDIAWRVSPNRVVYKVTFCFLWLFACSIYGHLNNTNKR